MPTAGSLLPAIQGIKIMGLSNILHEVQDKYKGLSGVLISLDEGEYTVYVTVQSTDRKLNIQSNFPKQVLLSIIDCNSFLSNRIESLIPQVLSAKSIPKKKALTSYNSIW